MSRQILDGRRDEVITKLKEAFTVGSNVTRACAHARISTETYRQICLREDELGELFRDLRFYTAILAEKAVHKHIKKGNLEASKWYLNNRLRKSYHTKIESRIKTDKAMGDIPLESKALMLDQLNQAIQKANAKDVEVK